MRIHCARAVDLDTSTDLLRRDRRALRSGNIFLDSAGRSFR